MNRTHVHSKRMRMRPEWWPENEPWPPYAPHGKRMFGRFIRRAGCLLGVLILISSSLLTLLLGLLAKVLDLIQIPGRNFSWILPLAVLLFVIGFGPLAWAVRGLRHISVPFEDLIEAVGRLADGDYTARVVEQGPSEVRSLEQAFNSMATRLQSSSENRRNLMADVTHELRTPLTVIQGNLEGLLDGLYPADETHLKSILEETHLLSRLVEDLRTLSLAESGALELRKEPTDLGVLIGETVSAFQRQADAASVRLEMDISDSVPQFTIDPQRMREVLTNLVTNALRYTPPQGLIRLRLELADSAGEKVALLTVEDTGPGIKPEDLPHVFERFYKGSDSGGLGLGLAIAKYLVEAHAGTITVESQYGQGTRIQIKLPAT